MTLAAIVITILVLFVLLKFVPLAIAFTCQLLVALWRWAGIVARENTRSVPPNLAPIVQGLIQVAITLGVVWVMWVFLCWLF